MPDLFKRSARTTLKIKPTTANVRAALTAHIEPMVRYLVSELAELVVRRIDADLERVSEAVEVAISAFASASEPATATPPPTKPSAEDWLALMNTPGKARSFRQPNRPRDATYCVRHDNYFIGACTRCASDAEADVRGGGHLSTGCAVPEPAVAAEQGSTSFVGGAVSPPALVDLEESPRFKPGRAYEVPVPTSNGRKCSKCGRPGGRADQCGTGHQPLNAPPSAPNVYASAKAKVDRAPVVSPPTRARLETNAERRARIAARAPAVKAAEDRPISSAGEDDNPNAEERWTKEEIDEETSAAHARKLTGELPGPLSTWTFE